MRRFVSCIFFKSVCIFIHDDHDHDDHDHACHHGGMCRALRHGFYCECLPGFMGTRCEGLFRVSFSSQCVFSFTIITITIIMITRVGMCRVRRHGLYCECLPGFMGTRCEGLFRASFSSHCAFSNTDSMKTIAKAISVTSTIVTITIAKTIIVTMGQFHRRVVARV